MKLNILNIWYTKIFINDKIKTMKKIELLSPAGDLERLKTAIIFGADAAYLGLPDWSLRNPREITFNLKTLKQGIDFAHQHNKKVYLTFNIFPHENQLKKLKKDLLRIKNHKLRIDGIIISDLGVLSLFKKYLPNIPIHLSTQANTVNSEAVKQWVKLGARRIVLARELTLEEIKLIIKAIKNLKPRPQLEIFAHGAMCIAYSGRCLLSKYFADREANLGDCAQSCRWKYRIKMQRSKCKNQNYGVPSGRYYIEEELRLNNLVEVQEDPYGTYFLNSKDLMTLDILDKIIKSGIDALKIEGRAKSPYYVATVTRVYRKAIDAYYENKYNQKLIDELKKELELVSNRGYHHGFLLGEEEYEQNYQTTAIKPNIIFCGIILETKNDLMRVLIKNKFKKGENIEIVTPQNIYKTKILEIFNNKKEIIKDALTPQDKVWVKVTNFENIKKGNLLKCIIRKRKT